MNFNVLKRTIFQTNKAKILSSFSLTYQKRRWLCSAVKWDKTKLDNVVEKSKIVVFMKGVPSQPMCGFSNAVAQILRMHGVDEYDHYNILDDDELRKEMKVYSNWPTFPQVPIFK